MKKRLLTVLLALLLAHVPSLARTQTETDAQLLDKVRSKIARLGVGEKAKATLRLKDGTKVKGYVSQMRETDVVMRDRQTDQPTPVRFADIAKVDDNRGHGTAKKIGIGVAIGAGAVLVVIAALIASLDD
ncbi:MAG TPA: hypothetical protein VGV59_18835 [Pyrinomonadaceae bacterium]|nr:hypothetical protein [Pyrinomonadaceae bacterium]